MVPNRLSQVGVLHTAFPSNGYTAPPSVQRPRRMMVFLLSFLVCSLPSLYYVFQRPAIYQASASILTVAPQEVDQISREADVQHVTIQRQLLLGQPLLEQLQQRMAEQAPAADFDQSDLQRMLAVLPVPDTNLVELRATGQEAEWLAPLVNNWLDLYQDMRAEEIKKATGATTEALRQQYQALGERIAEKRRQLDEFRNNNEILSMGREENQALARLAGLSNALNKANEDEVKAKARLDAIRTSVTQGRAVVPQGDKADLAQLERRAQELRERLTELDQRYTRDFLALKPELRVIPEQLAEVEAKIAQKVSYGSGIVLTEAQQDYEAARQAVRELQRQLDEHKREATEFTARFAEHEALQEDLSGLEELYRETEARLIQIEVKNQEKYPQVEIVERAYQPLEPISPWYLRDAAIALGISLLAALLVVWLVDFLTPREKAETVISFAGVRLSADTAVPALAEREPLEALEGSAALVLPNPHPRELSSVEVAALLEAADQPCKQLIALLLCGISLEEAACLQAEAFDLSHGCVLILPASMRAVSLPPSVTRLFQGSQPLPLWRESEDEKPATAELDARLRLAAVDAGLSEPEEINAVVLRHTYLAYLVRQGVRLSELERVAGKMAPTALAGYGYLSPAGPGKPLSEIAVAYPVFS